MSATRCSDAHAEETFEEFTARYAGFGLGWQLGSVLSMTEVGRHAARMEPLSCNVLNWEHISGREAC